MNWKKSVSLSLVLMLVTTMVTTLVGVGTAGPSPPSAGTVMWVNPTEKDGTPLAVCNSFTIDIDIYNVTDHDGGGPATGMYGAEFKLSYNSTLINATSVVAGGIFTAQTYFAAQKNVSVPGVVWFMCTLTPPSVAFTGSGTLATITFHKIAGLVFPAPSANTTLGLYGDKLADDVTPVPGPIPHTVQNGYYYQASTAPQPPTASFTEDPLMPYVNQPVTFDASGSSDPDGTIVSYRWDFGDTNITTVGTPIIVHTYPTAGSYKVNLTVTDNHGLTDSYDETKTVIERPVGPSIDLYDGYWRQYPEGTVTPYVGIGPGAPSDSYAPGENVSLFANVTYNDEIVQNILVGFEVLDPLGRCVTYRTDRTNETGIAHVWFRIPIPCSPAEQDELFGHWLVIAKCKLQDDIINDTKEFKVGWIVEITKVITTPYTEWYKTETIAINVTLKNIAWVARNVTVIVVIYDECDVPIGQDILEFVMPAAPAVICSSVSTYRILYVHVPKWAYVGAAKVYANAFTDLPQNCGIPYCPEMMYPFLIKKGSR